MTKTTEEPDEDEKDAFRAVAIAALFNRKPYVGEQRAHKTEKSSDGSGKNLLR
jgi:hypothetical protein